MGFGKASDTCCIPCRGRGMSRVPCKRRQLEEAVIEFHIRVSCLSFVLAVFYQVPAYNGITLGQAQYSRRAECFFSWNKYRPIRVWHIWNGNGYAVSNIRLGVDETSTIQVWSRLLGCYSLGVWAGRSH